MKISKKFIKKSDIYLYFAKNTDYNNSLIIKENDLLKQYVFESFGPKKYSELFDDLARQTTTDKNGNPYAIGKKWTDWHITSWIEDIIDDVPTLSLKELLNNYKDSPEILELINQSVLPELKYQDSIRKK